MIWTLFLLAPPLLIQPPFVQSKGAQAKPALSIEVKAYAKVQFRPIDEMSGIVKSRRWKNTYWVHNDSGDQARFFAIRKNGSVIQPSSVSADDYAGIKVQGATNIDWEDIAIDGKKLYLADTGNNLNARKDLCIYQVTEPDPSKVTEVKIESKFFVKFPEQTEFPPAKLWNFDCEAVAARKGDLYFVSKWRVSAREPGPGASIYVVRQPKNGGTYTLQKLDTRTTLGGWVTAADISPDGKKLAVLVQAPRAGVYVFDLTKGDQIFSRQLGYLSISGALQCEAIAWDGPNSLIVTNEQRDLFEIVAPRQ